MKKDKTKNGTIPTDGIVENAELDQTQPDRGPQNAADEEASSSSTPTPPSADQKNISESQSEAQPTEEEVASPREETVPPAALTDGQARGRDEASASTDPEGAGHEPLPETDDLTGTPVSGEEPQAIISGPVTSATPDAMPNPVVVSFGSDLDPLIYPSLDGTAIAIGALGPPMVILDDIGLKQRLGKTWGDKILSGLDETGRLVGAQRFENDPEKIFRKGRKPGVVFAAIERLMEGKIDRRRIAESTRGYGVELELNEAGLHFQLPYSSRAQIGRLVEKADRIRLAREVHDKKLSVEAIKKEVTALLRKDTLDDHQTARALLRDIRTAGNLLRDEDINEFVKDKKRLKTLDPGARLGLRKGIEDARKNVALTGDILDDLEVVLWNLEREERENKSETNEEVPHETVVVSDG
jgi:hypothetical protein